MEEFDPGFEPAAFGDTGEVGEVYEDPALVVETSPVCCDCHASAVEFFRGDRGEMVNGCIGGVD